MINRDTFLTDIIAHLQGAINVGGNAPQGFQDPVEVLESPEGIQLQDNAKGVYIRFGDTDLDYTSANQDDYKRGVIPDRYESLTEVTAEVIGFTRAQTEQIAQVLPQAVSTVPTDTNVVCRVISITSSMREAVQTDTPRIAVATITVIQKHGLSTQS